MQGRFTVLSRFAIKFVEVASAGLASAVCAFCLGQLGEQRPAPAPPVVQVVPASEDAMRMARDDHALLAALVRKQTEGPAEVATARPAPAVAASRPAKPMPAVQARRIQRPEPAVSAEVHARPAEPMTIAPPIAAANSGASVQAQSPRAPTTPDATAAASAGEEEHPLLDRLAQIPAWLLPGNERVFGAAPRPPMPVGELFQGAM
jgi:hypothetical protein